MEELLLDQCASVLESSAGRVALMAQSDKAVLSFLFRLARQRGPSRPITGSNTPSATADSIGLDGEACAGKSESSADYVPVVVVPSSILYLPTIEALAFDAQRSRLLFDVDRARVRGNKAPRALRVRVTFPTSAETGEPQSLPLRADIVNRDGMAAAIPGLDVEASRRESIRMKAMRRRLYAVGVMNQWLLSGQGPISDDTDAAAGTLSADTHPERGAEVDPIDGLEALLVPNANVRMNPKGRRRDGGAKERTHKYSTRRLAKYVSEVGMLEQINSDLSEGIPTEELEAYCAEVEQARANYLPTNLEDPHSVRSYELPPGIFLEWVPLQPRVVAFEAADNVSLMPTPRGPMLRKQGVVDRIRGKTTPREGAQGNTPRSPRKSQSGTLGETEDSRTLLPGMPDDVRAPEDELSEGLDSDDTDTMSGDDDSSTHSGSHAKPADDRREVPPGAHASDAKLIEAAMKQVDARLVTDWGQSLATYFALCERISHPEKAAALAESKSTAGSPPLSARSDPMAGTGDNADDQQQLRPRKLLPGAKSTGALIPAEKRNIVGEASLQVMMTARSQEGTAAGSGDNDVASRNSEESQNTARQSIASGAVLPPDMPPSGEERARLIFSKKEREARFEVEVDQHTAWYETVIEPFHEGMNEIRRLRHVTRRVKTKHKLDDALDRQALIAVQATEDAEEGDAAGQQDTSQKTPREDASLPITARPADDRAYKSRFRSPLTGGDRKEKTAAPPVLYDAAYEEAKRQLSEVQQSLERESAVRRQLEERLGAAESAGPSPSSRGTAGWGEESDEDVLHRLSKKLDRPSGTAKKAVRPSKEAERVEEADQKDNAAAEARRRRAEEEAHAVERISAQNRVLDAEITARDRLLREVLDETALLAESEQCDRQWLVEMASSDNDKPVPQNESAPAQHPDEPAVTAEEGIDTKPPVAAARRKSQPAGPRGSISRDPTELQPLVHEEAPTPEDHHPPRQEEQVAPQEEPAKPAKVEPLVAKKLRFADEAQPEEENVRGQTAVKHVPSPPNKNSGDTSTTSSQQTTSPSATSGAAVRRTRKKAPNRGSSPSRAARATTATYLSAVVPPSATDLQERQNAFEALKRDIVRFFTLPASRRDELDAPGWTVKLNLSRQMPWITDDQLEELLLDTLLVHGKPARTPSPSHVPGEDGLPTTSNGSVSITHTLQLLDVLGCRKVATPNGAAVLLQFVQELQSIRHFVFDDVAFHSVMLPQDVSRSSSGAHTPPMSATTHFFALMDKKYTAKALAKAIASIKGDTSATVDLRGKGLGDDAAFQLMEVILDQGDRSNEGKAGVVVRTLDLCGNRISDSCAQQLLQALLQSSTLVSLVLDQNPDIAPDTIMMAMSTSSARKGRFLSNGTPVA